MEELLGGLIKDKDPRAEIVRAELDAMAREAEMTGLKLRRSKAYEEINNSNRNNNNIDIASNVSESAPTASEALFGKVPEQNPATISPGTFNVLNQHQRSIQNQSPTDLYTPQGLSKISHQQYASYQQEYDHQTTHVEQKQQLHRHEPVAATHPYYPPYPNTLPNSHSFTSNRNETKLAFAGQDLDQNRHSLSSRHFSQVNPLTGYMPMPQESMDNETGIILPSPDVMDHLLSIHFRFVHPVLPILHQRSLYEQIHQREYSPPHLLFAILGLSSRFSDNPIFRTPQPGTDRPPCTVFYERAKQLIKEEYDHSQIRTVQALLLMSIQQMGFCESQRAWLYVGMAIRMAQDLGLNKDLPEQDQVRDRLSAELRKRTWWSCYVVERLICAGLGRPLTITQQDCETGYPQSDNTSHHEKVESEALYTEPISLIPNFVHLIALSRIQGNIMQFIKARAVQCDEYNDGHPSVLNVVSEGNGHHVDISPAAFSVLDKSLTEWRQQLPESLQNPTSDSCHFGLFLHMTYNTLIILLHRPEIPSSPTSASLCTQAAATITDITAMLMNAKALTSMFISCLYAIFSAGIIHFINIPSTRRPSNITSANPVDTPSILSRSSNHAHTAKTDLKRCIDALKHLSTHWLSAARRAKVLEDLLDLKHVSLKDIENDSFQTAPSMPPWAMETSNCDKALAVPRETHDHLRQQCRSKVMAIQSLLATDDEFKKMQARMSDHSLDYDSQDDIEHYETKFRGPELSQDNDGAMDISMDSPNLSRSFTEQSPVSGLSSPSISTPSSTISPRLASMNALIHQRPLDADPMMLISTATFGDPHIQSTARGTLISETASLVYPKNVALGVMGVASPMTLTTLGHKLHTIPPSPAFDKARSMSGQQDVMLDPFSMPSSITFPDQNHGRQTSCGGNTYGGGPQSNTVWSTNAQTHRAVARAEPSLTTKACTSQQPGHAVEAEHAHYGVRSGSEERESDDLDLAWNDMPPTLGLDEWMTYIGALMMRWLASGESSPRSI
ncbi:fungal-specific transcription factor domain-domain-containing protein [Lobosporangium transversale]|uniref:Fungal-specific transcription factor domain-domain-containing protein n=1 Tax=Lobosporangium transversale TaxID=64571 RepID=A0A1Y2H439_9FUNG|nr:fungal-specific transcription factor domain-domain-containing protein [Lobosporangium transversale]ORZ28794.1 fungal-specific transcription factor domain-domain-containing protein [Lobosporangium transversale]|eukprot:XP_021886467.1 fungal-specific transcription factor domain-domain-containing protein [Lobosporangium transversale]